MKQFNWLFQKKKKKKQFNCPVSEFNKTKALDVDQTIKILGPICTSVFINQHEFLSSDGN